MTATLAQQILVFAKIPEPGRVKTRLIPALGPTGAAELHRKMLEHTLETCLAWQRGVSIQEQLPGSAPENPHSGLETNASKENRSAKRRITLCFDGLVVSEPRASATHADHQGQVSNPAPTSVKHLSDSPVEFASEAEKQLFEFCFPSLPEDSLLKFHTIECERQASGNLGSRLENGFRNSFERNKEMVVAIGTDCPGLTTGLLQEAFATLQSHPVVLGPSTDGGYYLIGAKQHLPELFQDMPWSTPELYTSTVELLNRNGLTHGCLQELGDVDLPEDLPLWEQRVKPS